MKSRVEPLRFGRGSLDHARMRPVLALFVGLALYAGLLQFSSGGAAEGSVELLMTGGV